MNDLQKHMSEWSAQYSNDVASKKHVTEQQGHEAKVYFRKRCPNVLNALAAFVKHVSVGYN